ncbi:6-bladed beta-propeller [Massilibacteroides vaginae]|uniref:6-bladed beta-propeller n=1 Tax=Massilibacteroides vaginae TaxID=1673718 RepID=UPI000A1CA1EA|nr:6-bladed beta-propeller [Massilibacteroides vaginae]
MKRQDVLFIVIASLFIGCQEQRKQSGIETIEVHLNKNEIRTSAIFSDVELIQLETNDNSLLSNISKSYLGDDHLFIKSSHELFLFNKTGEFVLKISDMGNGPNEYTRLSDFDVDETMKEIHILDKAQKKVLVYNYRGECLRSFPFDFWAIKLIMGENEKTYLYSGNEDSPSNKYKINVATASSFGDRLFQIDSRKKGYLHVNSAQNFYWRNGAIYFYEAFNDTIYSLTEGVPQYYINYDQAISSSFFDRDFQNIMSFFQEFNKEGFVNSTHNAFESDNNLFFSCFHGGTKYFNVYDKNSKTCFSYNNIIEDQLFRDYEIPFVDDDFEFWINRENEITYYIPAQRIKENLDNLQDQKLRETISSINDDDNPVIIYCKIKSMNGV